MTDSGRTVRPIGDVERLVSEFYGEVPFPGALSAYGPWQDQAPNLLTGLGLNPAHVSGKTVLDAGCGTGIYANSFAKLGAKVTAVDIAPRSLEIAESYSKHLGHTIDFRAGSLFDLPLDAAERFDLVISLGVIHHTKDPWSAFRCLSSRLAGNGTLIVGVYDRTSRSPVYAVRAIIRIMSGGDQRKALRSASKPLFARFASRYIGEGNSTMVERTADLLVHPHEKPVSISTLRRFYSRTGLQIVGSSPSIDVRDYSHLSWMYGRMPQRGQDTAIELSWLRWFADYFVVAGRRGPEPSAH